MTDSAAIANNHYNVNILFKTCLEIYNANNNQAIADSITQAIVTAIETSPDNIQKYAFFQRTPPSYGRERDGEATLTIKKLLKIPASIQAYADALFLLAEQENIESLKHLLRHCIRSEIFEASAIKQAVKLALEFAIQSSNLDLVETFIAFKPFDSDYLGSNIAGLDIVAQTLPLAAGGQNQAIFQRLFEVMTTSGDFLTTTNVATIQSIAVALVAESTRYSANKKIIAAKLSDYDLLKTAAAKDFIKTPTMLTGIRTALLEATKIPENGRAIDSLLTLFDAYDFLSITQDRIRTLKIKDFRQNYRFAIQQDNKEIMAWALINTGAISGNEQVFNNFLQKIVDLYEENRGLDPDFVRAFISKFIEIADSPENEPQINTLLNTFHTYVSSRERNVHLVGKMLAQVLVQNKEQPQFDKLKEIFLSAGFDDCSSFTDELLSSGINFGSTAVSKLKRQSSFF